MALIVYTSGTTGKPKGCLLSHRYELASGHWYVNRGDLATFGEACERIYNPLPVFHVNAGILSFFGAMLSGNCQIQSDRFHPQHWIEEIHQTRATVVHYLGVVVPMLLNQPPHHLERSHQVRFAIGAGVDPQRHQEYEERFGKQHKCKGILHEMQKQVNFSKFPTSVPTPLKLAMPDEFRTNNPVKSYRDYYSTKEKMRYPKDKVPDWFLKRRKTPYISI